MMDHQERRNNENRRNRDTYNRLFSFCEFYRSYMIIETKIMTPSDTEDEDNDI